jgi:hypothetical protein
VKILILLVTLALAGCTNFADMTPEELTEYHQSWYSDEVTLSGDYYMPSWKAEYNLADYDIDLTCHDKAMDSRRACMSLIGRPTVACNLYTRIPAMSEIHYVCGDEAGRLHELSHLTHEYDDS